jgi:hypothetical protein
MNTNKHKMTWRVDENEGNITITLFIDTPFEHTYTRSSINDILEILDTLVIRYEKFRELYGNSSTDELIDLVYWCKLIKSDIINGERRGYDTIE